MAKKHRILLPVLALLLIGACSRNEEIEQPTSPSGGVEVAILCDNTKEPQVYSLPDGTRTWIDDNDWASTRWDKNDKIALWATADGSNYTLNAQNFSLAYFTPSYSTAVFNSTVADMPAGTYTYTAVSPVPESVSGTQVSSIPQNRRAVTRKWDILAADPLTADALPLFEQSDQMLEAHRRTRCASVTNATHCDRSPCGPQHLGRTDHTSGYRFPDEVVGTFVRAADPSAPMSLTEGSKSITLDLNTPLTDEAENYAWAFINPTTVSGDISFTAYTANGYRSHTLSVPIDREMAAGHITPITLTIPTELPVSYVDFSVTGDSSNLGEEPYNLIVKAPEGMTFRDGTTEQTFPIDESNKYTVAFYGDLYGDLLAQQPLQVSFETENALVPQNVSVASFTPGEHLPIALKIPYLLSEDFDDKTDFEYKTEATTSNPDGISLSQYGFDEGWTGTRLQVSQKAMRISVRHETVAQYPGRLDTPPLAYIKPGKTVKLKVTFNANKDNDYLYCSFGTLTDTAPKKGNDGLENTLKEQIDNLNTLSGVSFGNIQGVCTCEVPAATNATRLSWLTQRTYNFTGNGWVSITWYMYLDNIRVTIVK
ncbi:MAG: hypothetical protein ACLTMF_03880 [Alistipes putredinis]